MTVNFKYIANQVLYLQSNLLATAPKNISKHVMIIDICLSETWNMEHE